MTISLLVSHLYVLWRIHNGMDSRYAAMLHFLYLWMWKGKDSESFPSQQASDLMAMAESPDRSLRAVALSCTILLAIRHGNNLPDIMKERIMLWGENNTLKDELIEVQKHLLTAIFGIRIHKQMMDKMMAQINRERQRIQERLNVMNEDEELEAELSEEAEQQMQEYIRKLNGMIKDGLDINLSNFAAVCKQDFFLELKNWLAEFDFDSPLFDAAGDNKQLTKSILAHTDMCDLDKYAMLIAMSRSKNINNISTQIPPAILESMLNEDDDTRRNLQKTEWDRNAYRYTMQNLFRLFHFSPWANDMENPFTADHFITDCSVLAPLISDKFLWDTALLLIRHSIWGHSATYLRTWMNHNGETDEALRCLALCDKHLGNNRERLTCLLRLEENNPDNLKLAMETGLCLIQEKRYEEALQRFFRLEINETYLHRSARSIAWCSMMLGNKERAQRYYHKLLQWKGGPSWEDVLNAGHCAWIQGNPIEASILYNRYLAMHEDNLEAWDHDRETLLELGLSDDDINLMRETIAQTDDL